MLRTDYKPQSIHPLNQRRQSDRRFLWVFSGIGLAGILALMAGLSHTSTPAPPADDVSLSASEASAGPAAVASQMERHVLPLELPEEATPTSPGSKRTVKVKVRAGDSLARIFQKQGIAPAVLHKIVTSGPAGKSLQTIFPGQEIELVFDAADQLVSLQTWQSPLQRLDIRLTDEGVHATHVKKRMATETAFAQGVIEDSLYEAGKKAGLSDGLIMELAGIFGWDIDFVLDIRKGDKFQIIYEKRYADGQFFENGPILAAEFINQGKAYRAVRYEDEKGEANYYTPEGLSMRKTFLRAPLSFMYISSGFKLRRFHPILKRVKAHRGIDYRAPKGTPVWAAGDGRVVASAYNKYNGNYVFIRHGERYMTKYLHFSRRAVKNGQMVRQGQVIGYVGSTGLAEAPHLHYEFLVDGVHRNPRTVQLPQAKPVPAAEKQRFLSQTAPLVQQLELQSRLEWAGAAAKSHALD